MKNSEKIFELSNELEKIKQSIKELPTDVAMVYHVEELLKKYHKISDKIESLIPLAQEEEYEPTAAENLLKTLFKGQ